uniref:Luciferase-like monooxygenase n=1 Tax=bacterium enrichment culture clone g13 TaxID=1091412 RepID=G4WWD6_9BACT|nr:luciferase-like monooxygenase [bacterium enrichment culture clone g13]
MSVEFSLLELASVRINETPCDSFNHAVAYAKAADALGFKRFWLAEHHNMQGIASSATAVLIGHIAGNTQQLRVGSGGIMLPNHSPLIVAEQFGTLASIYGDRIDLGLGRAPGTDPVTSRALKRDDTAAENFAQEVQVIQQLLQPSTPQQRLRAVPGEGTQVPIWILGSSLYSAGLAAQLGLPYSFAGHFAPAYMRAALKRYRAEFRPSLHLEKPYFMLGLPVIWGETEAQAIFNASTGFQRIVALFRGEPMWLCPPVDIAQLGWTPGEKQNVEGFLALAQIGDELQILDGLQQLRDELAIDEFMFTIDVFDRDLRIQTLSMLERIKGHLR